MNLAILISGRGSNMLALADAFERGRLPGARIALVLSDHADAHGLQLAAARGITTVAAERITPATTAAGRTTTTTRVEHEREIIAALQAHGIDLICLAGFMRLLSPEFIAAYRGRILNIHPSLLPAFPGLDAQRQAIAHGVKVSGCTVHFVDETLDGGPIITQRVVPVSDDDTPETLAARILIEEHQAYPEAVALVVSGNYEIEGRRVRSIEEGTVRTSRGF